MPGISVIEARAVRSFLISFWRGEEAATAVEYAVMLALIIGTIFASVVAVGTQTQTLWNNISNSVNTAAS